MALIIRHACVVLPDRLVADGAIVVESGRIAAVRGGGRGVTRGAASRRAHRGRAGPDRVLDARGLLAAPGFIDLHVHGSHGADVMTGADGVARVAATLARHGVTGFLPTSVACAPADLARVLQQVARGTASPGAAVVLGAHLESNFLDRAYRGAQPASCLRLPPPRLRSGGGRRPQAGTSPQPSRAFTAADILDVIDRFRDTIRIVTLAPELPHGLDLVRWLRARGIRVSLGHSGADLEQSRAAITAGAAHATHLFNRMPPLHHRDPGLAGAALESEAVTAELICDGVHVHPAMAAIALAAKGPGHIAAITDGTAGSGLRDGATATLGRQPIVVRQGAARLADGTLAGSVLSMDGALRFLVGTMGVAPVTAAHLCATTPARALGLTDRGAIATGARADLVLLDARLRVRTTLIEGEIAWTTQG